MPFQGKKHTINPHKQPEPELTEVKEVKRHNLLFQEAHDALASYSAAPMSDNRGCWKDGLKSFSKAVCTAEGHRFTNVHTAPLTRQ